MQNKSIAATASSVAEAIETAVSAAFLQVSGNASLPGTNLLSCYLIRQRLLKFCSCRVDTMYCMHAFTIRSHMIFGALYAKVALVRLIWLVLQQQQIRWSSCHRMGSQSEHACLGTRAQQPMCSWEDLSVVRHSICNADIS